MNLFVSHAQNFEDVLLWRALGHVRHGFYIDVGANDPEHHSVTKAFYDRGWRGINVEPLPHFAARFERLRTHDVNLSVAAGPEDGEITLYDVPDVDGWASSDRDVAAQHRAHGHEVVELTVPVRRLAGICEEYVQGEIHFLKVDVEGFETAVLQGMDFARWQPWIVVVEATLPDSRVTNHEQWEGLLTAHGYRWCYFDGLNRYYVSPKHPELAESLTVQPNVFDAFHSVALVRAWEQLDELGKRAERLGGELHDANARTLEALSSVDAIRRMHDHFMQRMHLNEAQLHERLREVNDALRDKARHAEALQGHIDSLLRSRSWRMTKPVRAATRVLRRLLGRGPADASLDAVPQETAPAPAAEAQAAPAPLASMPAQAAGVAAELTRLAGSGAAPTEQ